MPAGTAVAFRVYDLNGDGFVSPAELEVTLRKLAGQALSAEQLSEVQPSLNSKPARMPGPRALLGMLALQQ